MRDARDLSSVPVPNDMTVIEDEHPHPDARLSGDARGHHGNIRVKKAPDVPGFPKEKFIRTI